MWDGPSVVHALSRAGVTHVVWIPDSELGQWEAALSASSAVRLIRVAREGEAIALAAGLLLGGAQPIVAIQCTGLFEAGDALRNVVHDLHLPLFLIIGVRSFKAYQAGQKPADTCPVFTEPVLQAWRIPYRVLDTARTVDELAAAYADSHRSNQAAAVLIPE